MGLFWGNFFIHFLTFVGICIDIGILHESPAIVSLVILDVRVIAVVDHLQSLVTR